MRLAVLTGLLLLAVAADGLRSFSDFSDESFQLVVLDCSNGSVADSLCGNSSESATLRLVRTNETMPQNATGVALAIVNNSLLDEGWDFVFFQPLVTDAESSYYYVGYAEGYLTSERIENVHRQVAPNVTGDGLDWVNEHLVFLNSSIALYSNNTNWAQVGLLFMLMHGIADGYSARAGERGVQPLSFRDIFLMNFAIEYSDVANIQKSSRRHFSLLDQHCSALIKVTSEDIIVAHDTWDDYSGTIRQYKTYAMASTIVSFSAMAGMISSGDDFYLTSNQLIVQETTNDFFNDDLYAKITPKSISEFLRVMTANFLANNGSLWCDIFSFHNSGTYNNQYMIVDLKRYTPGQEGPALQDDLLWVAEQIPGYIHAADVTETLRNSSYWASYNTPFFEDIFNISGFAAMEAVFGPFFSYNATARAEIFHRQQHLVTDIPSMQFMMRFNEYQSDEFSTIPNCPECKPSTSPLLSIASRGDLVAANATLPHDAAYARYFARHNFGAVDTKITSFTLLSNHMQAVVINGPTTANGTLPVFRWPAVVPQGCPPEYDFPWMTYNVPFVPPPPHGWYSGLVGTGSVVAVAVGSAVALVAAAGLYSRLCTRPPAPSDDHLLA